MNTPKQEVVSAVYDAALNPQSFQEIFRAWDRDVLDRLLAREYLNFTSVVDAQIITAHFTRALEIFETTKLARRLKLQTFLDDQAFAAAIATMDGRILASNDEMQTRFNLEPGQSVQALQTDEQTSENFSQAINLLKHQPPNAQQGFCVRGRQGDGTSTVIVVETLNDHGFLDCAEQQVLLLKSCDAAWSEIGAQVIAETFGYTSAEINVLERLCDGLSLQAIAEERGSRPQTVKNQVKALLRKASVHSQSDLMRLVTGILHVTRSSPNEQKGAFLPWHRKDAFQRLHSVRLKDDRILQYADYGRKNGRPMLFIQGNTAPLVPRSMVRAMAAEGLRIIAPFKPGTGESSPFPDSYEPMLHFADCMQILDDLGIERLPLAGQCSGGIVCLNGAAQFASRIANILLVDVGAPLQREEQFRAMPPTSRRTFMTAREMPQLLYTPHTLAAEAFFTSKESEAEILHFAYGHSPRDLRALETPALYKAARDNIAYALADPHQAVDDLLYWMRDWEGALNAAARKMPVHFLHGDEHDWLPAVDLQAFCQDRDNVTCEIVPEAAQLFIFEQPRLFARKLRTMADLAP